MKSDLSDIVVSLLSGIMVYTLQKEVVSVGILHDKKMILKVGYQPDRKLIGNFLIPIEPRFLIYPKLWYGVRLLLKST